MKLTLFFRLPVTVGLCLGRLTFRVFLLIFRVIKDGHLESFKLIFEREICRIIRAFSSNFLRSCPQRSEDCYVPDGTQGHFETCS